MIDPRISMGVQAANVTPAISIFNTALNDAQIRAQRQQQIDQNALLNPLKVQTQEQAVQQGKLNLQSETDRRDLTSIANFYDLKKDVFESGDRDAIRQELLNRKASLQASGRSPDQMIQTDEALQMLESGDTQRVVNSFRNANRLARENRLIGSTPTNVQFGAQQTFKDDDDNLFFGTQKRNPKTGEVETAFSSISGDPSLQPEGKLSLVSGLGQTALEKTETEIDKAQTIEDIKAGAKGKSEAVKAGVGQAVKAFEKIPLVSTAINNYQDAIAAIDSGAQTGVVDRMLPSLNQASKELDNIVKRLGLDVVGNTTFGALSESELAFALKTALPDNMEPQELRKWLTAKKSSQQKILKGLNEMANYLGGGTKTIADWNNKQVVDKLSIGDDRQGLTTNPNSQMQQPPLDPTTITIEQISSPEMTLEQLIQLRAQMGGN